MTWHDRRYPPEQVANKSIEVLINSASQNAVRAVQFRLEKQFRKALLFVFKSNNLLDTDMTNSGI